MVKKKDWRKTSDYPTAVEAKTFSLDYWAAQFLMRNEAFVREIDAARIEDPARAADGGALGWNQKPIGKVLKKWGVASPVFAEHVEAGLRDSYVEFNKHPVFARYAKINETEIEFLPVSPGLLVLGFDLSSPIVPQIERAKELLKLNQNEYMGTKKKSARPRLALFPYYLRVLDAKRDKATQYKMIEVFATEKPSVGEDTIRNWIKAAESLRDGGYADLVRSPIP